METKPYIPTYERLKSFESLFSLPSKGTTLRENYQHLRRYFLSTPVERQRFYEVTKKLMNSVCSRLSIEKQMDEYLLWCLVNALTAPRGVGTHIRQHWLSYSYIRGFADTENKKRRSLSITSKTFADDEGFVKDGVHDSNFVHGETPEGGAYYEDVLEKFFANLETFFGCFKGDRDSGEKKDKTAERVHGVYLMVLSLIARAPRADGSFTGGIRTMEQFIEFYDQMRAGSPRLYLFTYKTSKQVWFNPNQLVRTYHSVHHGEDYHWMPIGHHEIVVFGSSKPSVRTIRRIAQKAPHWTETAASRADQTIYSKSPEGEGVVPARRQ